MSLTRRVYGGKKSRNSKKGRGHCRIGGKKTLKKGGKRVLSLGGKSPKNRKKSKRRSKGGAGYGGGQASQQQPPRVGGEGVRRGRAHGRRVLRGLAQGVLLFARRRGGARAGDPGHAQATLPPSQVTVISSSRVVTGLCPAPDI